MVLAYFTPATGFAGGALVGLSAAALLLISGDILGASGIISSTILSPREALSDPALAWKLAFLSTFLLLSNTVLATYFTDDARLGNDPSIPIVSVYGNLLGGVLVGFGTRLGGGCAAGHGICGMARLSLRSIVAVCTFMFSAVCTAMLTAPDNKATSNGTSFLRTDKVPELFNRWLGFGVSMIVVLPTCYALFNLYRDPLAPAQDSQGEGASDGAGTSRDEDSDSSDPKVTGTPLERTGGDSDMPPGDVEQQLEKGGEREETTMQQQEPSSEALISVSRRKVIPGILAGALFAAGLAISGMALPSKNFGFLNFLLIAQKGSFDPTLVTVMVGGCIVSFLAYQFVAPFGVFPNPYAQECPLVAPKFSVPTSQVIDGQLIGGGLCFGIGWGISGLCPGPAIFLAAAGTFPAVCYWWPAFLLGSFVAQKIKR